VTARPLDMDLVARLYGDGKSVRQIGALLGAGFKTVQRQMAAAGIERRPPGITGATMAGLAAWQQRRPPPRPHRYSRTTADVPCEMCGGPTRSRLRICSRTQECCSEYNRRYYSMRAKRER